MNCQAAILTEPNKPLSLLEIQWMPLQYGQVLVGIIASGICGAQLQEWRGEKGKHYPRLLGHEACVEVVAVGHGVRHVQPGDRCVAHWRKGGGIESESPKFKMGQQEYTAGQITTFSEYSVVSENRITKIPDDTPTKLVALLGCGLSTALGTIEREANLQMGESILIVGCGGLGVNLIVAAKLRHPSRISVVDIADKRGIIASIGGFEWGASGKYDVIVETSGRGMEEYLPHLAPNGRFIMVGHPVGDVVIRNADHLFEGDGKTIKATQGGGFRPQDDIPRYVRMSQSKELSHIGIISKTIKLHEINEGFELVRQGQASRILIEP